jgi:CRP/FNR family transcriptional regulator, cyclic AMP receptor protein
MSTTDSPPLTAHPFVRGMRAEQAVRLNDAACYVSMPSRHRIFDEGGAADRFWLIETGQVALDLHVPGHGPVIIETLGRGDVIGWSWLFPPFEWLLGAVTMQPTQAFELNGRAVRNMCDADPVLGHEITHRLITVMVRRLQANRIRLLDVYGHPAAPS